MRKPNYKAFSIDSPEAEAILSDLYGIEAKVSVLPGELESNFKVTIDKKDLYVLKISRPDTDSETLDLQQKILAYLEKSTLKIKTPVSFKDTSGRYISSYTDNLGRTRAVRLLSWIPGRLYHEVCPHRETLLLSLGECCGQLTLALQGFDHPAAGRMLDWDITNSLWTRQHLHLFSETEQNCLNYFQQRFSDSGKRYSKLRKSVVHNDVNDHNVIVFSDLKTPEVEGIIDFGDAVFTAIVNDVAITCAYGMMNLDDPLTAACAIVSGYHRGMPLLEEELNFLYDCIGMRLVITVTKAAINKVKAPENEYLQVSTEQAWKLLGQWQAVSADFACFSFRKACGFTAHPEEDNFRSLAKSIDLPLNRLFPSRNNQDCLNIDLSVSSEWLGHISEFANFELFDFKLDQLQQQHPDKIIAGGYLEPRLVYTTEAYQKKGNDRTENRTVHLGIDFWLPAGTPVHAPLTGEIVVAVNDQGDKEYGGLIIMKHRVNDLEFFSLYGHLSVKSATARSVGDVIQEGEYLASLGPYPENGNWPPHLHFEIMLSLLDFKADFPGVGYLSELDVWKSICPDPNLLFKLPSLVCGFPDDNEDLLAFRKVSMGKGMSLSYDEPLQFTRGMGAFLFDQFGVAYLDTVNNVAHVGHEHHSVVKAGQDQMALLNTNSRYLHKKRQSLVTELLRHFPPELCVVYLVNSGSEANELALRMAKTATGNKDILASEMGYHGNTNACVEVSSYKFDGSGGQGCPEFTHIFPLPDRFRGKYTGEETGMDYAKEVEKILTDLSHLGRSPAALIIESIISCGGQIELPSGFLTKAYELIRGKGGLCIADEVQVGCGRVGDAFWGFQLHDVVPDIVTIGKPLGNGHPVAAVVCTQAVDDAFNNGMEYFNTFGGNPVSCAIATEVLRVIREDELQKNALEVGKFLKGALIKLSKKYPILRDIRGQGLFLGIELTDQNLKPSGNQARYLVNRMKEKGILMSLDGPDHNVIKIKPPMVFSKQNASMLLSALASVLSEDYMTTQT